MTKSEQARADRDRVPLVGDFVKVISGPAFVKGSPIKGQVEEIEQRLDGDFAVMIRVPSGGLWGFRAGDLRVIQTPA